MFNFDLIVGQKPLLLMAFICLFVYLLKDVIYTGIMPIFFSWPDYQKDAVKMFLPQISSAQLDTEDFLLELLHIWTGLFTKWVHHRHSATCVTPQPAATQKQKFQVYELKQVLQTSITENMLGFLFQIIPVGFLPLFHISNS